MRKVSAVFGNSRTGLKKLALSREIDQKYHFLNTAGVACITFGWDWMAPLNTSTIASTVTCELCRVLSLCCVELCCEYM